MLSTSSLSRAITTCMFVACTFGIAGCSTEETADTNADASRGVTAVVTSNATAAEEQLEKQKPAPGTGNVQGKVMFNSKPVAGIEVTLCEEFSRFGSGCGGETFTAKTDESGEFVIANVPPKEYQALMAKVFDTDTYVFATQGYGISSATYKVEPDRTVFAQTTNLFKADLKVATPKAGSSVSAAGLALAWDPYPDAAYYKLSLFPEAAAVTSPYISYRVDSVAFTPTKPIEKGSYRLEVEAYNDQDVKLATNTNDLNFDVQ